jgi:hypothetical protein
MRHSHTLKSWNQNPFFEHQKVNPSAELLRTLTVPSEALLHAALLANGRMELPRRLRGQSLSETRHRYGQLNRSATPHRRGKARNRRSSRPKARPILPPGSTTTAPVLRKGPRLPHPDDNPFLIL